MILQSTEFTEYGARDASKTTDGLDFQGHRPSPVIFPSNSQKKLFRQEAFLCSKTYIQKTLESLLMFEPKVKEIGRVESFQHTNGQI